MVIIYRTAGAWGAGKGGPLTSEEIDSNFYMLAQQIAGLEENPPEAVGIVSFEVNGATFYVHMSDGSTLGPYTLPKQTVAPPTPVTVADAALTLATGHLGAFLMVTNPAGCAFTFPPNATVPIAIGSEIQFSQEDGAGAMSWIEASGVTIKKRADRQAATDTPGAVVRAKKIAVDTWRIYGDLAEVV